MDVYYNIEIQMGAMNKLSDDILAKIVRTLNVDFKAYDEIETYRGVLFFNSNMKPSMMRDLVRQCIKDTPEIYYMDVVYRWQAEINADRFVIWGDGHEQDYTGHMIYEED